MLAPVNVNEKRTEMSVPVQDRNGCVEGGQRFLLQLGDGEADVRRCGWTRRVAGGGQATSSIYETALRASGVDGVVTCLSSQQRRKTFLRSVPLPLVSRWMEH